MRWKYVVTFVCGIAIGVALCLSMHAMRDAATASKIKRSVGNALALSNALEQYKRDHATYPVATRDAATLSRYLSPKYLRAVPLDMYSDRPYEVLMSRDVPVIISLGRGGFIVTKGKVALFRPYRPEDAVQ